VPFEITIRLDPTDLVVPAGARLRVTIAGSSIVYDGLDGIQQGFGAVIQGPTFPSGLTQPVTILHDAAHPSALVYSLPEPDSQLLDVREQDQAGEVLGQQAGATLAVDGGFGRAAGPATTSAVAAPTTVARATGARTLPATGGDTPVLLAAMLAAAGGALLRPLRRAR
jgi:hypothetical protein